MNLADTDNPLSILHVEDNKGDVYVVCRALKKASVPIKVINKYDGESAMKYLLECTDGSREYPDIVLLDINLPHRNGDEILQWMKSNEKLANIPVLVLSSSSAVTDIEKMLDYGASRYLTKPFALSEYSIVISAIEECWQSVSADR